jgi:parvulin-like peptidyl-prolyl isomerase
MKKRIFTLVATILLSGTLLMGKTLVTVNGHKIDDTIIPKGYEQLEESKRAELMEHLIKEELIHAYLLKSNIINSAKFQEIFQQQKSIAEKQSKKASGKSLTASQIRNIKGSIALMAYQEEQFKSTQITPAQTQEFYNNNPAEFNLPDSIEFANIITKTNQEAQAIINRLKSAANLNETFIQIAKEYKQNGYMGWFKRGQAPENLFNTAYKAKPKTLIPTPIETQHGHHVVYLLNKRAAGKISFAESQKNIEMMLKKKKIIESLKDKIDTLYGNSEIIY